MRYEEEQNQIVVVNYLRRFKPNVLFTTAGAAGERLSMLKAIRVKRMGYTAGTPDLMIFEARKKYHGLFIEMKKTKGGIVSENQKMFLNKLNQNGYKAVVCRGAQEAISEIEKYFS